MKVGTSGICGILCAVADAIARTFPASAISFDRLTGAKYMWASPRTTAVTASGALLNGTCTRFSPAAFLNRAPAMKVVLARPGEEKFMVPGFAFARSISSFKFLAGTSGLTMR